MICSSFQTATSSDDNTGCCLPEQVALSLGQYHRDPANTDGTQLSSLPERHTGLAARWCGCKALALRRPAVLFALGYDSLAERHEHHRSRLGCTYKKHTGKRLIRALAGDWRPSYTHNACDSCTANACKSHLKYTVHNMAWPFWLSFPWA